MKLLLSLIEKPLLSSEASFGNLSTTTLQGIKVHSIRGNRQRLCLQSTNAPRLQRRILSRATLEEKYLTTLKYYLKRITKVSSIASPETKIFYKNFAAIIEAGPSLQLDKVWLLLNLSSLAARTSSMSDKEKIIMCM